MVPAVGQEVTDNINDISKSDIKREEIQRYFGYEDLFFRYTTLPYDTCQNVNQTGRFVDIGYLLIALLPIIILGICFKNKKLFYSLFFLFIVFIASCFTYSLINLNDSYVDLSKLANETYADMGAIDTILSSVYLMLNFLFGSLFDFAAGLFEKSNMLVYPLLLLIFLAILSFFKRFNIRNSLWIIFVVYFFLWLLLSGGILWYGFLFIPLTTLLILSNYEHLNHAKYSLRSAIVTMIILWVVIGSFSRFSYLDYQNLQEKEHAGKGMLNGNIFPFAMGLINEKETIDFTAPYASKALDKINSDNDLIYMIGTSFAFSISNNVDRIFQDNLLQSYTKLIDKYEEKDIVIEALKASNFRYIVVDLHTPSLDNTPEQSLTKKFRLLLQSLYQNPSVSLIATDRIVEFVDSQGNPQRIANVFGQKMVTFGSYAIYEIL